MDQEASQRALGATPAVPSPYTGSVGLRRAWEVSLGPAGRGMGMDDRGHAGAVDGMVTDSFASLCRSVSCCLSFPVMLPWR